MDKEAREPGESNVQILIGNERNRRQYTDCKVTQITLRKFENIVKAWVALALDPIRTRQFMGLFFSPSGYIISLLWDLLPFSHSF